MSPRIRRDQAGVTLVELLAAVSILGILMVALSSAIFVGLRSTRDSRTNLNQSNAEQIITTYVTKDVQAADAVVYPPATTCGGEVPKLELNTRSGALITSPVVKIAYAVRANGDLLRCTDGAASTIAHGVTDFTATGTDSVLTQVKTAASTEVSEYQFSFEVRRRQA